MMWRTTVREIRQSFGRFFAIFAIVALGVGFFAGVRITTPAMVHTVDERIQEGQLFDYRLISTLGWEKEDVEAIRQSGDVRCAEGAYSADVLFLDTEQTERVLKVHSLTQNINRIRLAGGRMPQSPDECLVDAALRGAPALNEELLVEDTNEEDTLKLLAVRKLKVVGYADSVCYINFERGTTSIGTGSIDGFLYVPEETFDSDVYTEVYVGLDQDYQIYSDAYKAYMDDRRAAWEELADMQAGNRFDRIRTDAEREIADGEQELAEKERDGRQELAEAKAELADAREELTEAEAKLADAGRELRTSDGKLVDAKTELDSAGEELKKGKKQLDQTKKQLAAGRKQLAAGQKKIDKAKTAIQTQETLLEKKKQELMAQEAQLSAAKARLEAAMQQVKARQEAAMQQMRSRQEGVEPEKADTQPESKETENSAQQQEKEELAKSDILQQGAGEMDPGAAGLEEAAQMAAQLEEQMAQLQAAGQQLQAGKQAITEAEAALAEAKKETLAGERN